MKPMILSDDEFNSLPDAEIQPKSPMILSDEEFNSLPDSEEGLKTDSTVEPDTSALEAAVTGLGQEASFGFADELAGLAGASLDRPITYLLDKLQGVPSDLAGEPEDSTFGERYVQSRDIARRQAKQAEETQPGAYLGGQIGGGIAQAVATGGAGLAAQAAKQGAKQLIKKGAIEGAKYGAKQGLGRSEAEVLEGDVVGLLKDVGLEAGLGAATGGAISAAPVMAKGAASKAGELLKKIPGVESGYKLGKEGISTSYEALMKEFKSTSKSLSSDIRNTLKKQGIDKADALELADSIGISINAGDSIETAIEKAVDLKNVPEGQRGQFITFLQKTIGDDPELNKKLAKLDQTRAKQLEKAAREGYELQATEQIGKRIEDVVPDSSVQGTLMGTEDVLKKTTPEGQELVKKNLNLQTLPDDASIPNIDVRSLKPTQIEELRKQVNKFANPSKKEGVTELEQVARSLAVDLNNLSNKATAGTSVQEANTKIATLLDAIRQSGMRGKVSATESATETIGARFLREQQEKDLNKMLMRFGQDADVDIQSFFSRLKEVDPKFAKIEEKNKYLRDAMTIAQSGQGSASTNVRSLVGGAQKTAALVSNVAGKAARKLESASPSKALLAAGREIMESSPESIQNVIQRVGSNPKYQSMVSQLQKAAEATTDTARKQVLFGLKQQPAFREMLRDAGIGIQPKEEEVEDLTQEQQPSLDNKTSLIDNTKDLLEKFSDIMIPKAAAADTTPFTVKNVRDLINSNSQNKVQDKFTSENDFSNKMWPLAVEASSKLKGLLSPSEIFAQWAHESNYGQNTSADFNYGGIKAGARNKRGKPVLTEEHLTQDQIDKYSNQGRLVRILGKDDKIKKYRKVNGKKVPSEETIDSWYGNGKYDSNPSKKWVQVNDAFASYDSPEEFVNHYVKVIKNLKKRKQSYATDPNYLKTIKQKSKSIKRRGKKK